MDLPDVRQRLKYFTKVEAIQRECFSHEIKKAGVGAKALSVSCGDGIWDYLAFKEGIKDIVATDIVNCPVSTEGVDILRSLGKWEFLRVEADKTLPFENGEFDISFSQDVIEHTAKPHLFLQEQYRVLKTGGHVIVGTPNLFRPANIAKIFLGGLQFPMKIGYNKTIGDYIHIQEFHETNLKLLMQEVGFIDIEITPIFFGIPLNIPFLEKPKSGLPRIACHFIHAVGKKSGEKK